MSGRIPLPSLIYIYIYMYINSIYIYILIHFCILFIYTVSYVITHWMENIVLIGVLGINWSDHVSKKCIHTKLRLGTEGNNFTFFPALPSQTHEDKPVELRWFSVLQFSISSAPRQYKWQTGHANHWEFVRHLWSVAILAQAACSRSDFFQKA